MLLIFTKPGNSAFTGLWLARQARTTLAYFKETLISLSLFHFWGPFTLAISYASIVAIFSAIFVAPTLQIQITCVNYLQPQCNFSERKNRTFRTCSELDATSMTIFQKNVAKGHISGVPAGHFSTLSVCKLARQTILSMAIAEKRES